MSPRSVTRGIAYFLLLAALTACASSTIHYRPRDWRAAGLGRWATTVEGLDLETSGAGGQGGAFSTELAVHNASLGPVVVAGARLATADGSVPCVPAPADDLSSRTVPAGETRRIALEFRPDAGRPTEPLTLVLEIRVAGGVREIAVPLARD